jgi:hypothetical protein
VNLFARECRCRAWWIRVLDTGCFERSITVIATTELVEALVVDGFKWMPSHAQAAVTGATFGEISE